MQEVDSYYVNGHTQAPFPAHLIKVSFELGRFWRAECKYREQAGVYTTAVGYVAGHTKNPVIRKLVVA